MLIIIIRYNVLFGSKTLYQYDLNNNLIKIWVNARKVEKELPISFKNISSCARGKSKTAGGYIWRYSLLNPK